MCSKGKAIPLGLDRLLELQEGEDPRISTQSAHEGGKVVSPTHMLPLHPREDSWYSSVRGSVDPGAIVRPEGLG
jgi:hypothetical protein